MQNDSQELTTKTTSNKDLWLFLIVLDVIFLCVFGFFLYKHFAGQLFNPAPVSPVPAQPVAEQPVLAEEEVVVVEDVAAQQPTVTEEVVVVETPTPQPAKVKEPAPQTAVQDAKQSIIITPTTGKYRRVTFRWFGEGNKVAIVSGFTMSKPQALKKVGDHWETTLSIAPGTYKFLYIIDGKNTLDPYAAEKDGRSVLEVK